MTNKKVNPAISRHFSKLAKKSWAVRKKKLLAKSIKVGVKNIAKK
jgi:hypothetical protein